MKRERKSACKEKERERALKEKERERTQRKRERVHAKKKDEKEKARRVFFLSFERIAWGKKAEGLFSKIGRNECLSGKHITAPFYGDIVTRLHEQSHAH